MSATPRTDLVMDEGGDVKASFARTLELETIDLADKLHQSRKEANTMRENWRGVLTALMQDRMTIQHQKHELEIQERDFRATIEALETKLAEAQQTVEDVCVGSCAECVPSSTKTTTTTA